MAKKLNLDPEIARLSMRLTERNPAYPAARKASILSAYRGYRDAFGSRLATDDECKKYLERLFQDKGAKRGYAVAMHLRDALRSFWGDDAGAVVTQQVRAIQLPRQYRRHFRRPILS